MDKLNARIDRFGAQVGQTAKMLAIDKSKEACEALREELNRDFDQTKIFALNQLNLPGCVDHVKGFETANLG